MTPAAESVELHVREVRDVAPAETASPLDEDRPAAASVELQVTAPVMLAPPAVTVRVLLVKSEGPQMLRISFPPEAKERA